MALPLCAGYCSRGCPTGLAAASSRTGETGGAVPGRRDPADVEDLEPSCLQHLRDRRDPLVVGNLEDEHARRGRTADAQRGEAGEQLRPELSRQCDLVGAAGVTVPVHCSTSRCRHRPPAPPPPWKRRGPGVPPRPRGPARSEEHTSELQSRQYLVCRLLLEKKKKNIICVLSHKIKKIHQNQ